MSSDDDLLESTLGFSGSYTSDDGHVTIRRLRGTTAYSAARFSGACTVCTEAGLTPPGGEPLVDLAAAARFTAAHRHGEVS